MRRIKKSVFNAKKINKLKDAEMPSVNEQTKTSTLIYKNKQNRLCQSRISKSKLERTK